MSVSDKTEVLTRLSELFGKRFSLSDDERRHHSHNLSFIEPQFPDAVVYASSAADVETVVRLCGEGQCPVIPFGVGTSLEGHVNAPRGGIALDCSRMDQVLEIRADDLLARVEPGVTREALNQALRGTGLFFPLDPGANATLGGMAATRASGTNALRYGTMKDVTLSLEVVLADARRIRTASRARKTSAGYDLTRLFVGSEGTLGVITELTLRLAPLPESIIAGYCHFPDVGAACRTVISAIQSAIPCARIELMDALQVAACNAYSNLNLTEAASLFLEFHGSAEDVSCQTERFEELAREEGGSVLSVAEKTEDRARLWKARHDVYWSNRAFRPGCQVLTTDACVPISRLAECVEATQADIAAYNLVAPLVGHVGDGNFHVSVLIREDDPDELERAKAFAGRLSKRAIAMEGTCTGEHGIGQGKQAYLVEELGEAVDVMRAIKSALDPDNLFNPDKIFSS